MGWYSRGRQQLDHQKIDHIDRDADLDMETGLYFSCDWNLLRDFKNGRGMIWITLGEIGSNKHTVLPARMVAVWAVGDAMQVTVKDYDSLNSVFLVEMWKSVWLLGMSWSKGKITGIQICDIMYQRKISDYSWTMFLDSW